MLSDGATILDSIRFGFQGADISIGRCPDGTGAFDITTIPTYNANNCAVGIKEIKSDLYSINLFPNPANQSFQIQTTSENILAVVVCNSLGEVVYTGNMKNILEINTSTFSQGIYFISIANQTLKLVVTH
jgi:LEA14-like dessication related protein